MVGTRSSDSLSPLARLNGRCPLLGEERTSRRLSEMSAFDPTRTSVAKIWCNARPIHRCVTV
jgi:hypothetical protein